MKFSNEINTILRNSGVQLNEEQSDEFLLVQKIIRKITELKNVLMNYQKMKIYCILLLIYMI